jgi:hypothetical protein
MAEPRDRGTVSMRVTREISVSRLEKQLLVKVYDILIPVAQEARHLPPHHLAETVRRRRLSGNNSHSKGV